MAKLIILGSANAIPDSQHENTHMAVVGQKGTLLIDCPGNPIVRLRQAGLKFDQITDMILTHFHPDHVTGVPLFLMDLWLMGRQHPLKIHGLDHTLDRIERSMAFYEWGKWPGFFPVDFNRLPEKEMYLVFKNQEWRVFSSPVRHLIPNIGLRIEFLGSNKIMAYSCDTEPCSETVRLAHQADVLIHESTGTSRGHSTPNQAGEIASRAGAKMLYLIHYPTGNPSPPNDWLSEAKTTFSGPVALAKDFMVLDF